MVNSHGFPATRLADGAARLGKGRPAQSVPSALCAVRHSTRRVISPAHSRRRLRPSALHSTSSPPSPPRAGPGRGVCSLRPDGMDAIRRDLGETRTEALMRELNLFVRRNLRGTDVVAHRRRRAGAPARRAGGAMAETVGQRLLAASRAPRLLRWRLRSLARLTLSLGVAASPVARHRVRRRCSTAARAARATAGSDGLAFASRGRAATRWTSARFVGRRRSWRGSPTTWRTWCAAWGASWP